jgi:hypothetical protein
VRFGQIDRRIRELASPRDAVRYARHPRLVNDYEAGSEASRQAAGRIAIVCMQSRLLDPKSPRPYAGFYSPALLTECVRFANLGGGGGPDLPVLLIPSPSRPSTKNFPAPSRFFH